MDTENRLKSLCSIQISRLKAFCPYPVNVFVMYLSLNVSSKMLSLSFPCFTVFQPGGKLQFCVRGNSVESYMCRKKSWLVERSKTLERKSFGFPLQCTLIRKSWNPLLLQSHRTFMYLQRNAMNNNKVSSRADTPSCGPFVFAKGIIGVYCPFGKAKWFSQHDLIIKCQVIKPTCFASTQ